MTFATDITPETDPVEQSVNLLGFGLTPRDNLADEIGDPVQRTM